MNPFKIASFRDWDYGYTFYSHKIIQARADLVSPNANFDDGSIEEHAMS